MCSVSIHHNSNPLSGVAGSRVIFFPGSGLGSELAYLINYEVCKRVNFSKQPNERDGELTVLKNTKMPAVVTETGYMSNDGDMNRILTKRNKIAEGIAQGIKQYFANR